MSCGTVLHSELNPNARHIKSKPPTMAVLLYCGQRIRAAKVNGATMYRIPIADVPMAGIPEAPEKGSEVL
jgi:hypothetical protein